ncbi:MAG: sugar ABC transporter ATP-binding protein [Clostridia bacterium]|nr:sugar ABC transporter ATP-binding protein [Clostridia bacterium]
MQENYLLQMTNISKFFPGVKALDGVTLNVRAGSIHALMGENGAGKSTLMKCLFGIYSCDSGEIYLNGKKIQPQTPKEALELGIAMVHQELNQALTRNVADNIWLGRYPTRFGIAVAEKEMKKKTAELFEKLEIKIDAGTVMNEMSVSRRQMAEIAKAVSYDAKIIVLDEPTSSLNDKEAEQLFKIIKKLRDSGCGIIYISHKMEEIMKISDEVTVMRDGRHIATEPCEALSIDKIIHLMVGRELKDRFPPKPQQIGETVLRVENLSARYANTKNVSFDLKRGEIVGVAGLDGSGRTELLETLFGLLTKSEGKIILQGEEIRNNSPSEAIKNKFALITEERRATGIFSILDITDNTVISNIKSYRRGLLLDAKKMRIDTDWGIAAMKTKTPSRATKIRSLSGGKQQKVILARWLLTKPSFLLLDEPTRGIDVGAKYEIYQLITELAKEGKSVLMVSSEMPELLGLCHRILVMSGGRLAGELDASSATQEEIMALAAKFI